MIKAKTRAKRDPEGVRADILEKATIAFADRGLDGASIDDIAELTDTSSRMIYYYYGSKEGLYRAVLEGCYQRIRSIEARAGFDHMSPTDALACLVRLRFDNHIANPDYARLVMAENINRGRIVSSDPAFRAMNSNALESVKAIYERGVAEGVMRRGITPMDLNMTIVSLCFFYVANRYTFSALFDLDMTSLAAVTARREEIVSVVLRYVALPNG